MLACALAALPIAAPACSEELPSPALVDKLRLLALSVDRPDVRPGTGVAATATWVDGSPRAGRPVHFHWRLCAEGAEREPRLCLRPERGAALRAGFASEGADRVEIPAERLPFAPPSASDRATVYIVLALVCPDAPAAWEPSQSQWVCPSEAAVPNERREGIQAVRRVVVRAEGALNQNPAIAQVTVGGRVVASGETVEVPACPAAGPGGQAPACEGVAVGLRGGEGSSEARPEGGREALLASFFATAGGWDRPRAVAAEAAPLGEDGALGARWRPPAGAGRSARLWVVLRDGRGGDAVWTATATTR